MKNKKVVTKKQASDIHVGDKTTNEETVVEVIVPRKATFKGKPSNVRICIVRTPHGRIKPLIFIEEQGTWYTYGMESLQETSGDKLGYHYYLQGIPTDDLSKIQRLLKKGLKKVVLE